jgi:hypothetical protein
VGELIFGELEVELVAWVDAGVFHQLACSKKECLDFSMRSSASTIRSSILPLLLGV